MMPASFPLLQGLSEGNATVMHWFDLLNDDEPFLVEITSLDFPFRDRERIGQVLSMSRDSVLIQTTDGQRIRWENDKLMSNEFVL